MHILKNENMKKCQIIEKKAVLQNHFIQKWFILPQLPVAEEMVKLQSRDLSYRLQDCGD